MATIDEKAMNGADLKRFAALVKKTASQSAHGMMSKEDKAKLDGIEAQANKTVVDAALSSSSTNPVQNKAINTALGTKTNTTDLSSSASGKGSSMVAYDGNNTVKEALDDLYETIGGSGGSSIMDLVEDLQDGENLIQGTNVTLTKDTANHTVTIAAADPTVAQTSDSSTSSHIPILFANGSSPATGDTKYNPNLTFKPYANELKLTGEWYTEAHDFSTAITMKDGSIVLSRDEDGLPDQSVTLSYSGFTGTAAKATADGNGNNIANTYALKTDVMNPHPTIVTTLPTADGTHHGFYFVKDTSSTRENVYIEYIEVQENSTWKWEPIGSTDVTLDVAYLTTTEVETIWNDTSWT